MSEAPSIPAIVRLIASEKSWIEGEARRQLERSAQLPGMRLVVGLPDLHPGKGHPVGAAFFSQGMIYPDLVGSDIGCGMGLWRTDLSRKKLKRDRWAERLSGLESPWEGDAAGWLARAGVAPTPFDAALGTIGGGNHFAELEIIEQVMDAEGLEQAGLARDALVLLVHSGSRGLGEAILRDHTDRYVSAGLPEPSEAASAYLARHDHAVAWAVTNRALIAERFLESLGASAERVLDVAHNTVTRAVIGGETGWLHRKGAAPSDQGPLVIPGSRGALSYLVNPAGDQHSCARSLAHGAGRKWNRADTRERLRARYRAESLTRTELGSRVICEDKELLYEEAPQAYKDIDRVVQDLLDAGLIRLIASLRPLITYKLRKRP